MQTYPSCNALYPIYDAAAKTLATSSKSTSNSSWYRLPRATAKPKNRNHYLSHKVKCGTGYQGQQLNLNRNQHLSHKVNCGDSHT